MIGFLRGVLVARQIPQLWLDVAGVGYELEAPISTFGALPTLGETVRLYTHLVVREDAHQLFGFASEDERSLFRSLIRINGVGARLALAILSGLSVDEFYRCIECDDVATLVRLPGIGRRTAERLIVEMRDRLPVTDHARPHASGVVADSAEQAAHDAVSALVALGYKPPEASRMVRAVAGAQAKSSEDLIRMALRGAIR